MVCHGASHKSGPSQPRARANIPCDIYTHNAAPTPNPRLGAQHTFSACRKASSPTAGHSAAVCCNLLSDLCRLLPPLAYRLSSASQSGGAHIGRTGDAATQCCHTWWPENTTKECTSFVLVFSYAHARAIDRSCDRGCHKAPRRGGSTRRDEREGRRNEKEEETETSDE